MSKKLYTESASGGIRVISGRKIGEVRIPNYVYDLWLPLIGGDALSVYGVYCRLERQNTVKAITLKDIARACRIGDGKLAEINQKLERCGFVVVRKPTGLARGRHFTTEIVTMNPPRRISQALIEAYQIDSGYVPLSSWLVEEKSETPNSASPYETPNSASPSAKQRVQEALNSASSIVVTLDRLQPLLLQPLSTKDSAPVVAVTASSAEVLIPVAVEDSKPNPQTALKPAPAADAPQPPISAPPPSPRSRNPIFDATAQYVAGITSDEELRQMDAEEHVGTRIGILSSWLQGKTDRARNGKGKTSARIVGFISRPATADQVQRFGTWCKEEGFTPPLDLVKFVEQWRKFASAVNKSDSSDGKAYISGEFADFVNH